MVNAKAIECYNTDFNTNYSCPHCNTGRLIVKRELSNEKQYLSSIERTNIIAYGEMVHYDIYEYKASIGGILTCDSCGDYCSFVGEVYGGEGYSYCEESGCDVAHSMRCV